MKTNLETKEKIHFILLVKRIYFTIALIISLLIILKSIAYLNPDFNKGFLINKKHLFNYYKIALYTHIFSAPIAILSGLFQFTFYKSKHHKKIGSVYIFFTLFLAAPSAFFMSFYAIGGFISIINFLLLSILWFYYTYKALLFIKKGLITKHVQFIIGSFILTNSAVLLRIFLFTNNQFEFLNTTNGYIICSILSWLPLLLTYELFLKKKLVNSFLIKMNSNSKL